MDALERSLSILYINTRGQTKFTLQKQLQIQDLIKKYKCDIVHLQETDADENVFEHCGFIKNNFTILTNNSPSGYGTCSLVQNDLKIDNVSFDTHGRIIIFDIGDLTLGNVYLEAGTDGPSRSGRENYLGETIPQMLVNRCKNGVIGGDWNCIVDKKDATNFPESKMSKNLSKLMKLLNWNDSHKISTNNLSEFSHYYANVPPELIVNMSGRKLHPIAQNISLFRSLIISDY